MGTVIDLSGMLRACHPARAADFPPPRVPTDPGVRRHGPGSSFSRRLTHAASRPPEAVPAWRNPAATSRPGTFFSEAEAQRLTLSPGLPHHRHALTADEALAGIVVALILLSCVGYALARLA